MNLNKQLEPVKTELQIAPLIDVVFLLLIYFIMTASLVKKEGDISFILPTTVPQVDMINIPVEVLIEIAADGTVRMEGFEFPPSDQQLNELVRQVMGLKKIAETQQAPFSVNLIPNGETRHDRVVNVMDACAAAGVKNLTFSESSES